ncbi:hypothetical protein [Sandaracinus amylolyticus]|uniref:hypothetical protein n=1 Tax=Sandaracinus amylolyticus TaxID=927083 RepID=UPI001F28CE4E|nr:hypothetical protein [Sandaracinus amylolyticus]UJR80612.1 Hypothetical protein I5071_26590 [Sandaracinus amylolyticus]
MRSSWLPCSLVIAAFLALAGCGAGAVGEACERPGSTDDCVDDAICATDPSDTGDAADPVWDSYTCRALCVDESDCPADQECRGVTGAFATRACQPVR